MIMTKIEIKLLRKRMGMTQEQFAAEIPVVLSTIQAWERGTNIPLPIAMARLDQMAVTLKHGNTSS